MARTRSRTANGPAPATPATPTAPTVPRPGGWASLRAGTWPLAFGPALLLPLLFSFRQVADWDIGIHLHAARWIVTNHDVPRGDTFTWSVPGNEYVDLHWLYQLALYGCRALFGDAGLTGLVVVAVGTVFALLLARLLATGAPAPVTWGLFVAAVLIVEIRVQTRPEIVTWAFLSATLLVLDDYDTGRGDRLWLLPLIQLVWTNAHALFVLGWAVIGAYALSRLVHRRAWDGRLVGWCAAGAAASLLSPYGVKGLLFPFYVFTRVTDETTFKQFIGEFVAPWSVRATEEMPYAVTPALRLYMGLAIATAVLFLLTLRRRRLADGLILAAFFYLSFRQVRNVPLFVLVAAPVVAAALRDVRDVFLPDGIHVPRALARWGPPAAGLVALLVGLRVVTDAWTTSERRPNFFGTGISRDLHPIETAEFLLANRLDGKLLNDLNTGSWLGFVLPQKVYVDGRLEVMREPLFQELSSSWASGLPELCARYDVKLVVLDHGSMIGWVLQLRRMPGWRLVHADARAAVYLAPGYRPDVPSIRVEDEADRMGIPPAGDVPSLMAVTAAPSPAARWLYGFVRRQPFPVGWTNLATLAAATGEPGAAERLLQHYLRVTRGAFPEGLYNLGTLYYRNGRPRDALLCYEAFLRAGFHSAAQARVDELARYR